ncbi:MAG: polysaccharide deacetylase family protein [Muribaculaceae bacterium]|nr:polysaccharide deacetylase family protein [Muribaculaceae bacterium]
MLIEQPPLLYRLLFPECIWRIKRRAGKPVVFLTFDDGPIPEQTPWVLDLLDRYGIKATFFMVGDNVRKYPELYEEVKRRGHSYGNHTMHHMQGMKVKSVRYLRDVAEADNLIRSSLFRPPHGLLRWKQAAALKEHFNIVMYDLVTRDYSKKLTADEVFANVRRYARNGSIIVFHDSIKSGDRMREALPKSIEWLLEQGYEFLPLQM